MRDVELWLNPGDRAKSPVVIYEQKNIRITVVGNTAHFEMKDKDRLGEMRWIDVEADIAIRHVLNEMALQQIALFNRQNIDEPARQD